MHIRFFSVILLLLIPVFYSFAEDIEVNDTVEITEDDVDYSARSDGFIEFLETFRGKEVSITVTDVDVTINGMIVKIFDNGVWIKTIFDNEIFILRDSIGYISVSRSDKPIKKKLFNR